MVSETDKPSVESDKDSGIDTLEDAVEATGNASDETSVDGQSHSQEDSDLTADDTAEGDVPQADVDASDAVAEENAAAAAAAVEHDEDFNEIVGATTRTVHEDITRFLDTFERSARRWEMVVYPAMFAFIILAGYGFFLIYSLTNNMDTIASGFDPRMEQHMETLAQNVSSMGENIALMTDQMRSMEKEVKLISGQMVYLSTMQPIADRMAQMEFSVERMAGNLELMRHNMHDISKPMSRINDFMPW